MQIRPTAGRPGPQRVGWRADFRPLRLPITARLRRHTALGVPALAGGAIVRHIMLRITRSRTAERPGPQRPLASRWTGNRLNRSRLQAAPKPDYYLTNAVEPLEVLASFRGSSRIHHHSGSPAAFARPCSQ